MQCVHFGPTDNSTVLFYSVLLFVRLPFPASSDLQFLQLLRFLALMFLQLRGVATITAASQKKHVAGPRRSPRFVRAASIASEWVEGLKSVEQQQQQQPDSKCWTGLALRSFPPRLSPRAPPSVAE